MKNFDFESENFQKFNKKQKEKNVPRGTKKSKPDRKNQREQRGKW